MALAQRLNLPRLDAVKTVAGSLFSKVDPDRVDLFEPELVRLLARTLDRLARLYFRMEVEGMENVPHERCLIVGNHNAGITYLEPIGIGARWYLERGLNETLHFLVHDAMVAMPGLKQFLIRTGCVRASHKTADQLLAQGKKVVVFPGGNLDAFRPYKDRYKIVFGGKKGFIRLALRHGVPIVPMVVAGGHESFFVLHDGQRLARLLGLKKLLRSETCAVFLGLPWGLGVGPIFHLPLPAKSTVRFLPPIPLDAYRQEDAEDSRVLEEIYEKVTQRMQQAMDEIAARRKWPVFG